MIRLDGHKLTIQQLCDVARCRDKCELATGARKRMRLSREMVEQFSKEPRAIYGINTGFGPLSGTRVDADALALHQVNLLHHLAVGQGPLFSPVETRAIMCARANALARGFSGIREKVVDLLIEAINRDILPEIPSLGSVGASGDLVPLSHMARLLVGMGHARVGGKRLPALKALSRSGLSPVVLQCKEGLALVNGTSVMTALACLSVEEATAMLGWAELLSACMFQLMSSSPEVLCEQIHKARGFRGQLVVAERITAYLRTHPEYRRQIDRHAWGTAPKPPEPGQEIQDPYSIRCTPQVLGAVQDALWHIHYMVNRELNASTDNPLAFPKSGSIIHGGNFYGLQVSMACDYLRIGMANVALLVERQLDRLVNWKYSCGLPPLLSRAEPGLNSGLAGCQLLATSLAAECRLLSAPASVQTISTNANNQDVVSMGCISARMARSQAEHVWRILAIQALAVAQAADIRGPGVFGRDSRAFQKMIREVSAPLLADRPLFEDIARVTGLLQSKQAQKKLLRAAPECPAGPVGIPS
ncbi:MAG: aromatic amino acid ammonia-lyase [bacterium]